MCGAQPPPGPGGSTGFFSRTLTGGGVAGLPLVRKCRCRSLIRTTATATMAAPRTHLSVNLSAADGSRSGGSAL